MAEERDTSNSQGVSIYKPVGGVRQARKGLSGLFRNLCSVKTDFRSREAERIINELIRPYQTQPVFASSPATYFEVKSSDSLIQGKIGYFPPGCPDVDHVIASVIAVFNFNSHDAKDRDRYQALEDVIDSWRDRYPWYVTV